MRIKTSIPSKRMRKKKREEWHVKFAWLPTFVDEEDTSSTVVWFETYMRKAQHRFNRRWYQSSKDWTRYTNEEYMKRKLRGDFNEYKDAEEKAEPSAGYAMASNSPSRLRPIGPPPAPQVKTVVQRPAK